MPHAFIAHHIIFARHIIFLGRARMRLYASEMLSALLSVLR